MIGLKNLDLERTYAMLHIIGNWYTVLGIWAVSRKYADSLETCESINGSRWNLTTDLS